MGERVQDAADGELSAGGREADVYVVLVARVGDHDSRRAVKPGRVADEDHTRSGGDEAVDEILGEPVIDLPERGLSVRKR